ncbi:MAG: HupE/UreJ family protein [Chthoniobacteraceae bacterium]
MRLSLPHFLALLLLVAVPVSAHPSLQDSMWVLFAPDRIKVAVNVSLKEILVAQQNAKADDQQYDAVAVNAAAEKHRDYVVKHLQLTIAGRELAGQVSSLTPPEIFTTPEKTFFQYSLEYPLTGPPPANVTFRHDMLREFPYSVGQSWDVSYVVRVKREGSDEVSSWLLRYQQPSELPTGWEAASAQASDAAAVNGWRTFGEYLHHGVMHILTGYDHLLFVSALVLATLSFWEMVKVIAAFTAAHTITLALSVFDIFRLPSTIVEPTIALSIVFVALENVLFPRRAHSRIRLAVAFGFGLIHGLGFAGGLLDAMEGLPSIGIWIALAAFSLGVEIGHQIVVLPLFGLLALGRSRLREGLQGPIVRYGSTIISVCGMYYLFVSVHEQFFAHR